MINNLEFSKILKRYPQLAPCEKDIIASINTLIACFQNGGKLLVMGNGGSSSDAEHICGELMKGFLSRRTLPTDLAQKYNTLDKNMSSKLQMGLPAISLGVAHSLISAFGNDVDPDYAFAQQVFVLGGPNDVVMGITTSGNSRNVVHAFNVAKSKGLKTIALTGEKESASSEVVTVTIRTPGIITHEIQELHLPIYHSICLELERFFFT